MNDPLSLDALILHGLLKNFEMPNMKINTRLLDMLMNYWDPEQHDFMIDQMSLRIDV